MITSRFNSMDPVRIANWRWQPFLDHVVESLNTFKPEAYKIPQNFLQNETNFGSDTNPLKAQIATWGCRTYKLKNVRAACLQAEGVASVLNLVIHPDSKFDLPFSTIISTLHCVLDGRSIPPTKVEMLPSLFLRVK